MAATRNVTVVFVHGWSVHNTATYGGLPERLTHEGERYDIEVSTRQVYLGEYISFRDQVRLRDISDAFQSAVELELRDLIREKERFVCITHSTGGPVMRDWWSRYYFNNSKSGPCPMSHLIMLAPANFGSALAQLGKNTLGRLKAWWEGIEPGENVLDWLELGSQDAIALNKEWIQCEESKAIGAKKKTLFPFVLTGQSIDHKLYDHVNSYTGEKGSDGVVRLAAANLNSAYVRLEQEEPRLVEGTDPPEYEAPSLVPVEGPSFAPDTAFCVIPEVSHSGSDMGIMRSVAAEADSAHGAILVKRIFECIQVQGMAKYRSRCKNFKKITATVQEEDQEVHSRYAMLLFRVQDDKGYPLEDFDLLLTAGDDYSPDKLPKGFFVDRQRNKKHPGTITYYVNYDVIKGCDPKYVEEKEVRPKSEGAKKLGIKVIPRPAQYDEKGFLWSKDK
ncbi:hypothetical protein GF373_11330, partial [bacterium]|nr:hypothetical protein [bacterium]